jgi:hypothetical protein
MDVGIFYRRLSVQPNIVMDMNNVMITILELYEVGKKSNKRKYLLDIGQKSPGGRSLASRVP